MRGRIRGRVRTAIVALGLIGTLAGPAQAADPPKGAAKGDTPQPLVSLPGVDIGQPGGSRLTEIHVTPDLNCAVNYAGDMFGEFYGNTACGTLIAANGTLYGPAQIPAGGNASPRTSFTTGGATGGQHGLSQVF